ncbi:DUF4255 domain-containing protein [Adhaeribacter arboris]|uniref:DUF4255 domain-containing protein n=1 Tax=Adhaeribacter arboris TaxID=2072846 RepID=A0A2T2Y9W9_9BACT|nr:DUF4255 domain-containing protein [Adhaeribacter arboris]PSR52321.1 DUF4255 domain-containing protein [Adhaeribacter arboris]
MIDNALKVTANEVNRYLVRKLDPDRDPSTTKRVATGNVAKAQDADASGSRADSISSPGILTLVNLEEERNVRNPNNYVKLNDKIEYRNPKLFINLYCLFSVNHSSYDTALQYLSLILQFFQYKNVITPKNTPADNGLALDPKIEKLIFEMVSMNAEQVNHLWATLGGKYLPSVLYKVRLITIEEDIAEMQAEPVSGIYINHPA